MSAPDLPRFVIASDTWSVLDTWDVHRIVAHESHESQLPLALRKKRLEKRRAELEAWHERAMADG